MGEFVFRLPDVGEGLAEAELVEWSVAVGDDVAEDAVIASVMTDKATVDIPSPVSGRVLWLGGEVGDVLPIGADLIRFEVSGDGNVSAGESAAVSRTDAAPGKTAADAPATQPVDQKPAGQQPAETNAVPAGTATPGTEPATGVAAAMVDAAPAVVRLPGEKPLAAPSVRRRAQDSGVDLRRVAGSGPAGRITHDDLDAYQRSVQSGSSGQAAAGTPPNLDVTDIKVVGLRRKIAEKMVLSKTRIPHITYVEEVDMTKLEELRDTLNETRGDTQSRLTLLPFLMRAIVRAVAEQPGINAHFDDEAEVIHQYGGVHIGIATQTDTGLVVPVVRHVETLDVWASAAQVSRLADGARAGSLTREELNGSTITITSLGPMGGLVTTPVINHPEVAIVGVNKMAMRPMWDGSQFIPRKMMNISASFDHRVVDGWDAATFVQKLKSLLETPAMIFMPA
jgi:2-oxoisovalerate dehydrogenase E2 component (dihydrolipoyl transacylase)